LQPADTSLGSKYLKNTFLTGARPKAHFGVFRAKGTWLVAASVVLLRVRELIALGPNHLAGFEGRL